MEEKSIASVWLEESRNPVNVVLVETALGPDFAKSFPRETRGKENLVLPVSSPEDARAKIEALRRPYCRCAVVVRDRAAYAKSFTPNDVFQAGDGDPAKTWSQVEWSFGGGKKDPKTFFWSDPHFGHRNIIKYCHRPWNSGRDESGETVVTDDDVRRMDDDLVANFNAAVGPDDLTWCLGDFALGDRSRIPELVSRLNGRINLVMGNHDWFRPHKEKYSGVIDFFYKAGFNRVYDKPVIINDFVVLSHAPMPFIGKDSPMFSVFGHVHDSSNYETWTPRACCVCVERHGYAPVPMDLIMSKTRELRKEAE